jgi:hypothetical protein
MRMIGSIRVEFVFVTDFPARGRSLSSLSLFGRSSGSGVCFRIEIEMTPPSSMLRDYTRPGRCYDMGQEYSLVTIMTGKEIKRVCVYPREI